MARRVGPATAKKLAKLGVESALDLLYLAPRRLQVWDQLTDLGELNEGDQITFIADVIDAQVRTMKARRGAMLTVTLQTDSGSLSATFFAKHSGALTYHRKNLVPGQRLMFAGKISQYRGQWQLTHPTYDDASELSEAEVASRAAKPVPIYPAVAGLPSWAIARAVDTILETLKPGEIPEVFPDKDRKSHDLSTTLEALRDLHHPASENTWLAAKRRLAWDEALITQSALALARVGANSRPAPVLSPKTGGVHDALRGQLPWELTSAQSTVLKQLDATIGKDHPMQTLLQGDVGSGKTIVALLAMCRAVDANYQAALLAPTEVLAAQHARTLRSLLGRLANGGTLLAQDGPSTSVELLTGSANAAEKRRVLARLASGEPLIVVGTHALLSENVQIPSLGLVVVDEQHRFGVAQRDTLRERGELTPHVLVMTATPIPRTVAMTVFGDLDVEVLESRPAGRAEVSTFLVPAENQRWMGRVWERAAEEIKGGGHVYVVCPRIDADTVEDGETYEGAAESLASVEATLAKLTQLPILSGYKIGSLHGRMSATEKDEAMADFQNGKTPIMVSTTVIEVGVDDPQATMMIILDAQQFGLSQLHQLRGRIGRGNRAGICMAVMRATESPISAQRLSAFAETTDGFILAEKDLELRAEGDVLGHNQAGYHSGLKFLKVRHHGELIRQARKIATQLVEADPKLEEHPQLKAAIELRLNEAEQANLLRA
ncbi:hypothetical protein BM477_01595 [Boudabousia marimammalium]|uniref:Uncharacterized protein n=1 Tax=Boudabousia marimammalium TaxID=156892 RepID=A0A1Q5PSE6_9ACTO|nr:hypothetical protein BM477_01595 [Boudabousia marimammalium]